MAIELRIFDKERDYETVLGWWQGHGWSGVSPAVLPKLGVIADGLAAAWLYMDNSTGVAMLEWMVSNPEASARDVLRGLDAVTEFLKKEAHRMDYGVILTSCRQQGLVKFLEKRGFVATDAAVTHLLHIRS